MSAITEVPRVETKLITFPTFGGVFFQRRLLRLSVRRITRKDVA